MTLAADSGDAGTRLDNPLAAHPIDEFSETRDRPLFSPTRRPPAPVLASVSTIVAPPPPPLPPPSVVLLGVVSDGNGALAMIRGGQKTIRARLGEEIEGWLVTQIEARRLVLSHDDRSVSFALFANTKGKNTVNQTPPVPEPEVQNVAQQRPDRRTGRY
jgi:general secretion pathway protein N